MGGSGARDSSGAHGQFMPDSPVVNLDNTLTRNPLNMTMTRRNDTKASKRDLNALDLYLTDTNQDFELQKELKERE